MISLIFKPLQLLTKNIYSFCASQRDIINLSRQLINNHQKYKGWKNIRLLYTITIPTLDGDSTTISTKQLQPEEQNKIYQVIDGLSNDLHTIPHREINMLLQILKERKEKYEINTSIFRALNKQAKILFGKNFKATEFCKSFTLLKELHFPKATLIRMTNSYLELSEQRIKKQANLKLNQIEQLKLGIIILQQSYLALPLTKLMVQQIIKIQAKHIEALAILYHISRILPKCLNAKVQYELNRSSLRQILFNPYNNIDLEQKPQENTNNNQSQVDKPEQNDLKNDIKIRLKQASDEILNIFYSAVNIEKLEKLIKEQIQTNIDAPSKQVILFTSDILELKPFLSEYLAQNVQKFTPIQFIYLVKKVSKDNAIILIKQYYQKLQKYMSIQQKIYLSLEVNKYFHIPIEYNFIIELIKSIEIINYNEYMGIMSLINQIPHLEKQKISQILILIKQKIKQ